MNRYTTVLAALAVLILVPAVPQEVPSVQAIPGCPVVGPCGFPCFFDLCPPPWAPYGPFVKNLQFNFYSSDTAEFNAFEQGHLDLTDSPLPPAKFASYDSNPDLLLSPTQGGYGYFGIYFNGASSTWAAWGCNWNSGPPSTPTPGQTTYTTACGINMRQALMHLVDRPRFVTDSVLQGSAQALVDPSPPAKDPSGSSLATQCSWDTMFPNCISAYNIAPDPGGFAAPGSPDFCAAADHMIAAGVASGKTAGSCVLTGINPGVFTHHIRAFPRNNDPRRLALGNGLMNAINQLFGATVVDPTYGTINNIGFAIVFSDPPIGSLDDWDYYTYGYSIPGPFPDHLFDIYGSQSASDYCGGVQNGFPDNPTFVCIPTFDTHAAAASNTDDVNVFRAQTLSAFDELGKRAVEMPVFSPGLRTAALRSMDGLVNELGAGYSNFWTALYGRQSNYTPFSPIYRFGGGDPTTLRWGQAQGTGSLNIFRAQSESDRNVLSEIYDTLVTQSPVQPASVFCWMCDSFVKSVDASGNTHFLVELRQDLRWHDGVPLDSKDVKFSLLNFRDFGTPLGGAIVQTLESVTVLSPNTLDIAYLGRSISYPLDMAEFIIPRHVWELPGDTTYGDVGRVDPAKLSPSYDPVLNGALIGSGPFLCRSVFPEDLGRVGTSCVRNADGSRGGQTIPPGGMMNLQAFDFTGDGSNSDPFYQYMRSYNVAWGTGAGTTANSGQFQEFSWADKYDNATVTIQDLASVASCFGKSSVAGCVDYSYWLRPAFHPSSPDTIGPEVSIVASHLDDTWIFPFSWSGDQSRQPGQTLKNIVPFTP